MIDKIIKYKYFALFLPVLLTLFLASGVRFLSFSNDYHMFFSADNPQLIAFDNLQDTYNKSDSIVIGLRDTSGIFTEKNLNAIADITEKSWQTPFSTRVDSLSNYQHTFATEDDLVVVDLVDIELDKLNVAQIDEISSNEILLKNRLITHKKDTTGVNITLELPNDTAGATKAQSEAVAFARNLRNEIKRDYPQFEVFLSGIVMLNNAFPEAGMGDMKSLVPLSFLIVFVLLFAILRRVFLVLGSMVVLILTIVASMGSAGHLGIGITPPMTSIPVIILTIAVAGSVHIMMSFIKHINAGEDKIMALKSAYTHNAKAISIACLTTTIGFLGLNFSEVPPFHDLGNVAAMGTLISWLLILIFLPVWMLIMPIKSRKNAIKNNPIIMRFAHWVIQHSKYILISSTLVAIGFIALIGNNEINDNFVEYFDERVEFRRDADKVDKYLTGIGSIDYSFDSTTPNGGNDPKFLADVEKFVDWIRTQEHVNNVSSITDIFKRLNKNMHGDNEAYYKLPTGKNLIAQYLLLYEMSLPYGLDLNNQINVDKSATRVSVNLQNLSSKGYLALNAKADKWLKDNTPNIHTEGASPSIMFANIGKRNVNSMILGTSITLVVISFLLAIFLGSVRIGLISLIPNIVPVSMAFGFWALVDGQITMSLAVVSSITLGIIVDDTVHFLSKYSHALNTLKKTAKESVLYAFEHVGNALILSSVALTAGFLVLVNSVFKLNAGMGELTSYIIIIALVMDFLLLPSLLLFFDKNVNQGEKS
jgi:predicted RND superfamily exporter protein